MTFTSTIYSRKILTVVLLIYFLNYFLHGAFNEIFSLNSQLVLKDLEFWRLFTYPLTLSSIESLILLIFSFYFIAPMLESKINTISLGLVTFVLIISFGIIHTLVFWNGEITLTGAEGISIAILALHSLFEPRKKVKVNYLPPIPIVIISMFFVFLWITLKYVQSIHNIEYFVQSSLSLAFGITFALLIFVHLVTIRKIFAKGDKDLLKEFQKIDEAKKYAVVREGFTDRYKIEDEFDDYPSYESIEYSETRLNEILDKIIEHGKDSLTYEEIKFLENYSRLLK